MVRYNESPQIKKKLKRNYRIVKYIIYRETLVNPIDHAWTFIGAFIGIALIGLVNEVADVGQADKVFLIGSFGASAVLVYGATHSPLGQPRNLLLGHLVSAAIGVTIYKWLGEDYVWLSSSLSVALSIVCMQMLKALHPPGGATALIANIGSEKIKALGYFYLLSPVFTGAVVLLLIALIVNNIPKNRNYPYKD